MALPRLLKPSVLLRRNALYRGLLGGSRGWLAVGAVIWGRGLLKRMAGKQEEVLTVEKLKAGQGLRIDAIKPDTEPGLEKWLKVNAEYAVKWPNITAKKEPPADAKAFEGIPEKFEKFFSPEPGEGD